MLRKMKPTKMKLGLLVIVISIAGTPATSTTALADPLFVAVGWNGEFTRIDANAGQIPPTRSDLPQYLQALSYSPGGTLYVGGGNIFGPVADLYTMNPLTGDVSHVTASASDIRWRPFPRRDSCTRPLAQRR